MSICYYWINFLKNWAEYLESSKNITNAWKNKYILHLLI